MSRIRLWRIISSVTWMSNCGSPVINQRLECAVMEYDKKKVIALLNKILEAELAGAVRYTHYSFMIFGYNRIPIVSWLREQAAENMTHAQQAGEIIASLGEYPSL